MHILIFNFLILQKILIRWFMPMKYENIKKEAILSVLLSFITNGADIVDFFGNVDEATLFPNQALTTSILGI